jgi:hypothetical protein
MRDAGGQEETYAVLVAVVLEEVVVAGTRASDGTDDVAQLGSGGGEDCCGERAKGESDEAGGTHNGGC